jgi:hypothetical protein
MSNEPRIFPKLIQVGPNVRLKKITTQDGDSFLIGDLPMGGQTIIGRVGLQMIKKGTPEEIEVRVMRLAISSYIGDEKVEIPLYTLWHKSNEKGEWYAGEKALTAAGITSVYKVRAQSFARVAVFTNEDNSKSYSLSFSLRDPENDELLRSFPDAKSGVKSSGVDFTARVSRTSLPDADDLKDPFAEDAPTAKVAPKTRKVVA